MEETASTTRRCSLLCCPQEGSYLVCAFEQVGAHVNVATLNMHSDVHQHCPRAPEACRAKMPLAFMHVATRRENEGIYAMLAEW
jgi:hypothetical protein